ncbi:MAG: haloacid dehalogenase [Metallosphaera yellowstonensis]|jgi:translin
MLSDKISEYILSVEARLRSRFESREKLLLMAREVIRLSGETISLSHRGRREEALRKYSEAVTKVAEIRNIVDSFPELLAGDVGTAFQEVSEATIVLSLYFGVQLSFPKELGIPDIYYITGIADAVGEMRRAVLESLRKGDKAKGREIMEEMETIYEELWKLEYPKSLVPGLRQKIDALRKLVEDTRHDLFLAEVVGTREKED